MLRGFTDSGGIEWRVWAVLPTTTSGQQNAADHLTRVSLNNTPFANGWLCFECKREKRRLAPIPTGWEQLEPRTLEELCQEARLVQSRHSRESGAA